MRQVDGVLHDVDLVFQLRLNIDGRVGNEQRSRIGRRVHHKNMTNAAAGAQSGLALHRHLHQLVGVQAAFHHRLRAAGAAHADAQLGGLALGVGLQNRVGADIDADLGGQSLHIGLIADQRGQDQIFLGRFDGAPQGHIGERPDHGGGNGRQFLAALKKLMKDVVVGGMANQRVNSNGFSQPCKIAHKHILLADAADGCGASPIDCRPAMEKPLCQRSQAGASYRMAGF